MDHSFAVFADFLHINIHIRMEHSHRHSFSDDIFLIKGGFIESYLKGSLSFEELWHPLNFGRTLGYNLLQLVNIKFFAMNSRILVLLVPFFMLASAILIYRNYKKSLEPENSPEFIAATFLSLP